MPLSDDDLLGQYSGSDQPVTNSDDDLLGKYTVGAEETQPSGLSKWMENSDSYSTLSPEEKAQVDNYVLNKQSAINAGFVHDYMKIPNMLAKGGANLVDKYEGNPLLGPMVSQDIDQKNAAYDAKYGNSGAASAGGVVGGIVAAAPIMGATGKVLSYPLNALTRASPEIASAIGNAFEGNGFANKLLRFGSNTTGGAVAGGEANLLMNPDTNNASDTIKQGAVIGGLAGGGIPLLIKGGSTLADAMSGSGPSGFGPKQILSAIQDDGFSSIDDAETHLKSLGPNATFADLGPNSMRLTRRATLAPGAGQTLIQQTMQGRQAEQGNRVMDSLLTNLGVKNSYYDTMDNLAAEREAKAVPLWQQAFKDNPSVESPKIDKILATPAGQKALNQARVNMQNDMSLMGTPNGELGEQARDAGLDVPGGVAGGLNLRTLHYVKGALDSQYTRLAAAGDNAAAAPIAGLRRQLNDEMVAADQTGNYGKGNQIWGGSATSSDALEAGRNSLTKPPEIIKKEISGLSKDDQDLYRMGAAQRVDEMVNPRSMTSDTKNAVERIKANPKQLAAIFPDQGAADKFANDVGNERTYYQTQSDIMRGSQTANKLAEGAEPVDRFDQAVQIAKHAAALKSGNFLSPLYAAGRSVANKISGLNPEKAEIIANMMMSKNPANTFSRLRGTTGVGQNSLLAKYLDHLSISNGLTARGMVGANNLLSGDSAQQ